ncbi:MAG: hypothetical protein IKU60_03270 [Clostridia bacterium]|nr:hypothetical protein [Clostridia bacterium]
MKNKIGTIIFAFVLTFVFLVCLIKPPADISVSERRPLAQMPDISIESVLGGKAASGFEKYATDQFPLRDTLRKIKATFGMNILGKKDNNKLFTAEGHISKIDDDMSDYMIDYVATLFKRITEKYMKDKSGKVYFSVVPDKNIILADKNGYPSMDYEAFFEKIREKTEFVEYIDITGFLSLNDYYRTDTHWRQEKIVDVAQYLAERMGAEIEGEYWENTVNKPFYGVYYGQIALPFEADDMVYLTNDTINSFIVTYYGSGKGEEGEVYNKKKLEGNDMYEMFLSGSEPLITIENPNAQNEGELVIFRDSFASSIAPLLAQGYKKTTLVDIRYMQSDLVGEYVDFENCDVLFLYSTAVLNTSTSMK